MLNLPEPAELLGGVIRFAEVELLQHRRVPSGDQLDLMADAIASIEFYLEAVKEGRRNRDKILDVTRRSLEALGYWPLPVEGGEAPAAELVEVEAPAAPAAPVAVEAEFPTFADNFTTERTQPPLAIEAEAELSPPEAPVSDAGAVEALIASFAQTEDTSSVIESVAAAEVLPEVEMSSVVQIAPGEGLEGLVIGESAPEALAPSVQDLDGLRISAEMEPAPEATSPIVESDTVEPTMEAPWSPTAEAQDAAADLAELDLGDQFEAIEELVEPVAEAPVAEPVVEARVEAPPPPVVAPAYVTPSIQLPDVGFHSVPSDEIDDEIREVFVEEVQDELDNLNRQYPAWKNDLGDLEKLKPVRRSFHTLKGSGRLVGALAIGEYAWKIENMLNRVLDKTIQPTPAVLDLLDHAIAALPGMLSALKGEGQPDANVGTIMWVSDQLATGQEVWLPKSSPAPVDTADYQSAAVAGAVAVEIEAVPEVLEAELAAERPVVAETEESIREELSHPSEAEAVIDSTDAALASAELAPESVADSGASPLDVDPMLMEILSSEVDAHLATIRGYLDATEASGPIPVTEELLRAVHTLNGALSMVDLPVLTRFVAPLEGYLKRLRARGLEPTAEGLESLQEAAACIATVMIALETRTPAPDTAELADRVLALRDGLPAPDHPFHGFGIQVVDEPRDDDVAEALADVEPPTESAPAATDARPWYEAEEDSVSAVELTEVFDAAEESAVPAETAETADELSLFDFDNDNDETFAAQLTVAQDGESASADTLLEPVAIDGDEHVLAQALDLDDLLEVADEAADQAEQQPALEVSADDKSVDLSDLWSSDLEESVNLEPEVESIDADSQPEFVSEIDVETEVEAAIEFETKLESAVESQPGIEAELAIESEPESDLELAVDSVTDSEAELALDSEPESELEPAIERVTDKEAELALDSEPETGIEQLLVAEVDAESDIATAESAWDDALLELAAEPAPGQVALAADDELGQNEQLAITASTAEADEEEHAQSLLDDLPEFSDASIDLSQIEFEQAGDDAEAGAESGALATLASFESFGEAVADEQPVEASVVEADSDGLPDSSQPEPVAPVVQPAELATAEQTSRGPVDLDPAGPLDLPDMDLDLLDIFVEEGVDILDHADGMMARLREAPEDREPVASLQRDLHTLKGGARMAGLYPIGDLSHAMESLFEAIVHGERAASRPAIEALEKAFDRLHGMVQRVRIRQAIALPEHTIARIEAILEGREEQWLASHLEGAGSGADDTVAAVEDVQLEVATDAAAAEPQAATDEPQEAPARRIIPARPSSRTGVQRRTQLDDDEVAARAAQQELIRVRADLLDNLVNFAGEVSIYRSRLEAQMGGFRFNLVEFEQTVLRLREQLRKLEMETEAQILSRFQRESEQSGNTEFDPLELDRFSTLQQLSRALAESVSDLVSIQNLLDDIARQSETLLLQQSRVSSDLQEGLMRTRMVPFESLVPRLRRILRQTAAELGKRAQLKVEGTQGEMDRTVLERMTAPFEHMLRNSLAHGIEPPEVRLARGKPEEGTVSIKVSREATEVLIQVTDDGGGMNRDAIRRKAIERGLMTPEVQLSDRDIFQFVLEAGFSTASEVSKVAGRGVGMDVVASEVKQLGGTLELDSDAEQGTRITIRLPFTLAVAQAVMVKLGEATYAIPMSSITGVTRMPRKELDRRLEQKQLDIVYGGETYQIYDLGDLLRSPVSHGIDETQVPLLMSKTGDQRAAVRVTQVVGSKEVVVKSAGLQLSIVPGIFGATIMGDGRVVVILDLAPLVRHGVALRQAPELAAELELLEPLPEPAVRRQPLVMVVDDSITMRKVTTRVLERSNFDVFTAKDGLDAVEQLQDRMPDVILLDIEMPRMDGYEVATYIRNDQRLKHIPIIMITSRTGEKHRQRALEVGVDRYLGKPYQENDLLKNVQEALTAGHANVH
ncbi:MAG TPA: Hpt domain-containing protein [Xanthomonadales bacterium]|nr:Hpt domain-containing protein [Xanthomonadales bacterium]